MTEDKKGEWQPTREQRQLLYLLGEVLDKQAGDGIGTTVEDGSTVWMDDLVGRIAVTFHLDIDLPLDLALRIALPTPSVESRP